MASEATPIAEPTPADPEKKGNPDSSADERAPEPGAAVSDGADRDAGSDDADPDRAAASGDVAADGVVTAPDSADLGGARAKLNHGGRVLLRHLPSTLGILLVALIGGILGAELAPSTSATIGPLQAKVRVVPSLNPGIHLLLPPAGQVDFSTHIAPIALEGEIARWTWREPGR